MAADLAEGLRREETMQEEVLIRRLCCGRYENGCEQPGVMGCTDCGSAQICARCDANWRSTKDTERKLKRCK